MNELDFCHPHFLPSKKQQTNKLHFRSFSIGFLISLVLKTKNNALLFIETSEESKPSTHFNKTFKTVPYNSHPLESTLI